MKSLKRTAPVSLPHDGPIHFFLETTQGGLRDSEQILNAADHCCANEIMKRVVPHSFDNAAVSLVDELRKSSSVQTQCSLFKKFRDQKIQDDATIRLLLEWSISFDTPHHLMRAIRSALSVIDRNEATIVTIHNQVLESICNLDSSSNDNNSYWKSPVHSLRWLLEGSKRSLNLKLCWKFCLAQAQESLRSNIPTSDHVAISQAVKVIGLIQVLLDVTDRDLLTEVGDPVQDLVWQSFQCPSMPSESSPTIGIVWGFLTVVKIGDDLSLAHSWFYRMNELTPVRQCLAWNGLLAACADHEQLWNSACESCRSFLVTASRHSDIGVRVQAFRAWRTIVTQAAEKKLPSDAAKTLVSQILELIWNAWESSHRALSNTVAALFAATVRLVQRLEDKSLEELVRLSQTRPSSRGRYRAMEILLPIVGAGEWLQNPSVLDDLLDGITNPRGHDSRVLADAWAKVLQLYFRELLKEKQIHYSKQDGVLTGNEEVVGILDTWCEVWLSSIGRGLVVEPQSSRRAKVTNFCLVRLSSMLPHRALVAYCVGNLIQSLADMDCNSQQVSEEHETKADRRMWAFCEILKLSRSQGWLGQIALPRQKSLDILVRSVFSVSMLEEALSHFSSNVRLAACQAIRPFLQVSNVIESTQEFDLWKRFLVYGSKSSDPRYITPALGALTLFVDGATSNCEKAIFSDLVRDFVVNFLIEDLLVLKLTYPGAVVDKQMFALALIEMILVLACEGVIDIHPTFMTKLVISRRRCYQEEEMWDYIRRSLLGPNLVQATVMMLHSNWDAVRAQSYTTVLNFVRLASKSGVVLPEPLANPQDVCIIEDYAVGLASSPKPRESDTGARLLAIAALAGTEPLETYLSRFIPLLDMRLKKTKESLTSISSKNPSPMPMAHGIIQGLRLACEDQPPNPDSRLSRQWTSVVELLIKALKLSLTVVADVDKTFGDMKGGHFVETTVNPGAIGANGIFSSVERTTPEERARRMLSQRVVMGCWLMTKEACAALASVISGNPFYLERSQMDEVGNVLICTLACLKHTGAAHAAHKALQQLASNCQRYEPWKGLPLKWCERLLDEISFPDTTGGSTLRRSTGYALGALSLMRSEVSESKCVGNPLSLRLLDYLVDSISPPGVDQTCLTPVATPSSAPIFDFSAWNGNDQAIRRRVLSLNILRFITLDAPLVDVVSPVLGDAIISALWGYTNSSWAIRNSSTMLFAAILLRVVDADRNAANRGHHGSDTSITISELYRLFPKLSSFLPCALDRCTRCSSRSTLQTGAPTTPLLPLLVLLRRIRPVRRSGYEAASQVQPILPFLMKCLSSRELVFRRTAAQALVNCVLNEKILIDLEGVVLLAFSDADWNLLHGNLLAIKGIVTTFDVTLSVSLMGFLEAISSRERGKWVVPCTCVILALEILSTLPPRDTTGLGLIDCSWQAMQAQTINVPNFCGLSQVCAGLLTKILYGRVRGSSEGTQFQSSMHGLLKVTTLHNFDARVSSVNVLKKILCQDINNLQGGQQSNNVSRNCVFEITAIIVTALKWELNQEYETAHPPTLRRLSRCLVECLKLTSSFNATEPIGKLVSVRTLEQLRSNVSTIADANTAQLLGNTLELQIYSELNNDISREATRLCDPLLPWKLRHSAVSSLVLTSGCHQAVTPMLLNLMQDEDSDVRHTACHFVSQKNGWVASPAPSIYAYLMAAPERAVSIALDVAIRDVMEEIQNLQKSLTTGSGCKSHEEPDIFGEEQPNTYGEKLLYLQMLVFVALKRENGLIGILSNKDEVLALLRKILETFDSKTGESGHLHFFQDPCQDSVIFVPVYSLLMLTKVALSWDGFEDYTEIIELSKRFAGYTSSNVLRTMAISLTTRDDPRNSNDFLFLLDRNFLRHSAGRTPIT